jgi:hypothetical protein
MAVKMKQNGEDRNRVTFKEFWAICMAQYWAALPGLMIMIGVLLGAYFLVEWLF